MLCPYSVIFQYFAGGALSDARANWAVKVTRGTYAPPGWNEYSFGVYLLHFFYVCALICSLCEGAYMFVCVRCVSVHFFFLFVWDCVS